ncbi:uncharacterized protein SOCE26_093080 [Sorangium cellulosum]|uniref:DUF3857 domain-containing protein n=1 Tax=Sorangium cellulosum TaxID=56 RepID=A0A2L0F861_SORCE|nr:hypothetical protein [Sorangium cellulosum]AUX47784.1 uncharacterized protein SOCE26_093080 [Sorangium cellulosum]
MTTQPRSPRTTGRRLINPRPPRCPRRAALALAAALVGPAGAACVPPSPAAAPADAAASPLGASFAAALEAEIASSASAAPYLDALERAVAEPRAEGALAAVVASTDALVLGAGGDTPAIAFRSRDALPEVTRRLQRAWAFADVDGRGAPAMPFARGVIAGALHRIALHVGDEAAAATWGARRGCAGEAAVIGPLEWTALRGLAGPSPVSSAPGAPLARSYPGVAPFAKSTSPVAVRADACAIDVDAVSALQGTRAVVVDLHNPVAQRVSLALVSPSAAVLEVGGVPAIRRGYEAGGAPVLRLATVEAQPGALRVVVRVAQKGDGGAIELSAYGENGLPLRARAPRPGDAAAAAAARPAPVELTFAAANTRREPDLALAAAALLAAGDARAAERLLDPTGEGPGAGAAGAAGAHGAHGGRGDDAPPSPRLDLLYARAIRRIDDLPETKIIERARAATERVLAARPASWEARRHRAELAERRAGAGEGLMDALRELGLKVAPPGRAGLSAPVVPDADRMVLAALAATAHRARVTDVAEAAYARLAAAAPGSALLADVDDAIHGRAGADAVKAACGGGLDRSSAACLVALQGTGDHAAALAEIGRLRRLRRAPGALRDVELAERVAQGDLRGALAVYDAMAPGERVMLEALGLAAGRGNARAARGRLARDRAVARDTPAGIAPISRALGLTPDPAPALEAAGRKLVLEDQAKAFLPGAATAVLRHVERFTIQPDGLVYYVTYDLRRVSGTTDVAQGAVAYGPLIDGRGMPRLLRRRIHKRDGRILAPDAASNAAQEHSDLSQLEQGDYVEQVTEGYVLPGDGGQLVLDTWDLLPERTSVREAEIELRRPTSLPLALWSHPLLGAAEQRAEGSSTVSVWRLKDQPPRRMEDGVPRVEMGVGVSAGTLTWAHVAAAIDENIRTLEDRDPYMTRWAKAAAGGETAPGPALLERVVGAAGKAVKIAGGAELSDLAALLGGGPQRTTARTMIELGQGSRSWVIYRALRELGVRADLAIAETEPFSSSADFPPHVGRFRHPLVIARLPSGDVWIDADIEGPPLPPGRISPELRGRAAMLPSGELVTVRGASGETGDEVDLRLVVDAEGNASGSLTILLHGRAAQSLSEAFETVVGTARREVLRGVVLGWLPWADVEDVVVSSTEGSWEVALRAAVTIHGFARPEGKDAAAWTLPGLEPVHLVFPRSFTGTLGATYASRGARKSALAIETALQYHVRRRIELPAGSAVARAPEGVRVEHAGLEASRKGSYGAVIEEDFALSLPTGTVAADEYKAFVERVQAVDSGFMAGIRVARPAGAAARPGAAGGAARPGAAGGAAKPGGGAEKTEKKP